MQHIYAWRNLMTKLEQRSAWVSRLHCGRKPMAHLHHVKCCSARDVKQRQAHRQVLDLTQCSHGHEHLGVQSSITEAAFLAGYHLGMPAGLLQLHSASPHHPSPP